MNIQRNLDHTAFIYDPRGQVSSESDPIAPRVKSLKGLRLGILDNSKWNANKLLRGRKPPCRYRPRQCELLRQT